MPAKQNHVHKLKRVIYKSGNRVFFCALPDCLFKINPALALGKRSLCWRCGKEFIMTEYCLRLAKPHCEGCHKSKNVILTTEDIEAGKLLPDTPTWTELSLSDRLNQTLKQAQKQEEEEI